MDWRWVIRKFWFPSQFQSDPGEAPKGQTPSLSSVGLGDSSKQVPPSTAVPPVPAAVSPSESPRADVSVQHNGPSTSARAAQETDRPWWLLRRTDQAAVAGLLLLGIGGIGLWWWTQASPEGHLVDIDQAPPLEAEFRVDINQATWPELAQLPGIGSTLARRIVQYRRSHGPFRSYEELENVRGLGPKTLQQIRPYLLPLAEDALPQAPPASTPHSPSGR